MTSSSIRSVTGVSEARRPRGLRGFARRALVLTWVIFWINTALFPFHATAAAAFGGHADSVSQSFSAAKPSLASNETNPEHPHHRLDSPCDNTLSIRSMSVGMHAALSTDHISPEWTATDPPTVPGLTAANHSAILSSRTTPPFRLYLHTQRLLI